MFWHHKKNDAEMKEWHKYHHMKGGMIGFFAFLGALIYFEQQATSFGTVLLAFIKALLWPVLLVYTLLMHLKV